MTIVLAGGGSSAGHITPNLAVAHELKRLKTDAHIVYVGHHGDKLGDIVSEHSTIDEVYTVRAGKFRRYNKSAWRLLFDIPAIIKNIRDMWWVLVGFCQSYKLLGKLKPDCVFIKGSYVGLVVGLAAAARGTPFVTHDSDALPGLANRIIARWAKYHAVALSQELYPYPADKTVSVGVPIRPEFKLINAEDLGKYKEKIGFNRQDKVLFLTGGGQGTVRLNEALTRISKLLLDEIAELKIVHFAGKMNESEVMGKYESLLDKSQQARIKVLGFASNLYDYSAAADVVVSRAGATTIAEMAAQAKACILVPNPYLTGGHQIKNAESLVAASAVEIVYDEELKGPKLADKILELMKSSDKRRELGQRLHKFARPHAAELLAELIIKAPKTR